MFKLFHRIYAFIFGYFWLPCPICKKEFGGHQKNGILYTDYKLTTGKCICPNCAKISREWHQDVVFDYYTKVDIAVKYPISPISKYPL